MTDDSAPFAPTAVDLRDYVSFDLEGATGRRVFATDVMAVDLVCLEPRQAIEARTFPTADVVYTVLGGRAWVVTDEAEATLAPLQSVMVPAAVPHGLRNDSADPLIIHVVVSPPDEAPEATLGPVDPPGGDQAGPRPAPRPRALDRLRRTFSGSIADDAGGAHEG